jgi:hypothetical protein
LRNIASVTRSRLSALALLLLLICSPSAAQCDYRTIFSGQFRQTAFDLALDGSYLWVATSYGVTLLDRRADPPLPVGSLAVPGPTSEVEVAGQFAYVASGDTLYTMRRSAETPEIVHSLPLGAFANDMIAVGQNLYIAASTGVVQIDLLVPDKPLVGARLNTSAGPAFSITAAGGVLYAADGDATIDLYSIQVPALPQMMGALATQRRPTSVRAAGGLLFASDDLQTDIFSAAGTASVRLGGGNFGAASVASHSNGVYYAAGSDRRLRAVDVSVPDAPVVLFEQELPASEGTVNRIADLLAVDGRLYVAAGDLGVVTFDARSFAAPFPLRISTVGPTRSVLVSGSRIFGAPEAGGLREYARSESGALTLVRQWDEGRTSSLHDLTATRMVAASGAALQVWDIGAAPPAAAASATLRAPVRSAVVAGQGALAVLTDGSLWRLEGSAPVQVPLGGVRPDFIARGASGLALAQLNPEGTTTVRWYPGGDLAVPGGAATIEGAATSGIAVTQAAVVAVVTFRGLITVDFGPATPAVVVTPRPGGAPARDVYAEGTDIFVLTAESLEIWDVISRQMRKSFAVSGGTSVHAQEYAAVATAEGLVVVAHKASTAQPILMPLQLPNAYYSRMTSSAGAVHLLRDGSVRSLRVDASGRPAGDVLNGVARAARDFAVIGNHTYTVSSGGRISGPGVEFQMNEGGDAAVISMHAVGEALYLSISRGCLSGACEKKTLLIGTAGGALTAAGSLPGALIDVEVHGNRAYALFDDPDEIRVLDISNAVQPAVLRAAPAEGNPVSIAFAPAAGTVYTIGQKIYAYAETTLARSGELLEPYVPDPTGRVSYLDQKISIDGSCAVVAGREFAPRLYRIVGPTQWQPLAVPSVPAAVRSIATVNGAHYLLTGYSLEIWSAAPPARRMRPVR